MMNEEIRKKISKSLIGNKNAFGYKHTEEAKKAMGLKNKGRFVGPKSVRFVEWDKLSYSAKHVGFRKRWGYANKCENEHCDGVKKIFHWANLSGKYKEDRDDWRQLCIRCHFRLDKIAERANANNHIPVVQMDIAGKVIKIHKGVSVAARELGLQQSSISGVVTGKYKTSGGYRWQYHV